MGRRTSGSGSTVHRGGRRVGCRGGDSRPRYPAGPGGRDEAGRAGRWRRGRRPGPGRVVGAWARTALTDDGQSTDDAVPQVGRNLGHAPVRAGGAHPSSFAAEGDPALLVAVAAARPAEAVREDAAGQVSSELPALGSGGPSPRARCPPRRPVAHRSETALWCAFRWLVHCSIRLAWVRPRTPSSRAQPASASSGPAGS
jgi:hypothetical protein